MKDIQSRQEADRLTRETLDRVAGKGWRGSPFQPTVCLIEHRVRQGDVPEGTQFIPMSRSVANQLFARGLSEPVSLTHLKGSWWVAKIDAAHVHSNLEYGGAYCTVVASTEQLIHVYCHGYVEVSQGPFSSQDEARQAPSTG